MNTSLFPWHRATLLQVLAESSEGQATSGPQAWLVTGLRGIGKSAFARTFAQALLCESPAADGSACGNCQACGWFAAGNHPDYRLLEPLTDEQGKTSKDIRIDQVRALADFVSVSGHRGARRPVVIDPADQLNSAAANALLKTLEEPTPGVVFLLVTHDADAVPPTVRSRCRLLPLPPPSLEQASDWLQAETGCSPADAGTWLAMAGGAPLQAAAFADPASADAHRAMLEAIARVPDVPAVAVADALQPWEGRLWLPVLQRWVMDLMRAAAGAPPRYFPAQAGRLAELSQRTDLERLSRCARGLAARFRQVEHPLNPRLFCEETLEQLADAFGGAGRSSAPAA
jgi:DNA polymerase III subunit delta'